MKHVVIACASVVCAIAASGCSGGDAGPAAMPFDPFGTESPPTTGFEPAGVGDDAPSETGTIADLCARACVHIESFCPAMGVSNCASDCASSVADFPGCTAEFKDVLSCFATAPLTCNGDGRLLIPSCDAVVRALNLCSP